MAPPRDLWTFTDWLASGGWGMYVVEASAAIALPLNIINAFRPGVRIRGAAILSSALVAALGLSFWWWTLSRLETALQALPPAQQEEIRTEGKVEVHGVLEAVIAVVLISVLAQVVSVISGQLFKRDVNRYTVRRNPWPPIGFLLYVLAGIFLLPQGAFMCAYAWGLSRPQSYGPWSAWVLTLALGSGMVVCGSLLRGAKQQEA